MIHTLDLHFLNSSETIAAFLVETSEGPILFECGPYSAFSALETELARHGYKIADIKHLLLTHIHFDHAGAAWALAKNGTQVHVHPYGYKHMHDPSRLYASAKRIYGDKMEYLWGKMEGISEELLHRSEHNQVITVGDQKITALYTPGHAVHHIAWQIGDEIIAGDVAGCTIENGPVVPPCPPPDINLEDWEASIDLLLSKDVNALYLTHFGKVTEVKKHLEELRNILWDWANFIKPHFVAGNDPKVITPLFAAYAEKQLRDTGLSDALISKYDKANPAWMSVAGLMRYWTKKE